MTDENKELLNKEIRGITGRNIIWFVSILLLIAGTSYTIISKIDSAVNSIIVNQRRLEQHDREIDKLKEVIPTLDKRVTIIESFEDEHYFKKRNR